MKKVKKLLTSPIGLILITTVLGFISTVISDSLQDKPVFSTIGVVIQAVWNFIVSFLNFELRVWWVLIGIIALIAVMYVWYKIESTKNSIPNQPPFIEYTKDCIDGWHWKWKWEVRWDGKYSIEQLHPVCPQCDTPLVQDDDNYLSKKCLRCKFRTRDELPNYDHIKVIISDNIMRGFDKRGGTP